MNKPDVLYHASHNKDLSELRPKNDYPRYAGEPSAVFATPYFEVAVMFLVPRGIGIEISKYGDTYVVFVNGSEKDFKSADHGGAIYTLSPDNFETNEHIGMGEAEWLSYTPVKPIRKVVYTSALDAIHENNVSIHFLPSDLFNEVRAHPENGLDIIKNMNPTLQLENLCGMTSEDKGSILLVEGNLKPSALVIIEGSKFAISTDPIHVPVRDIDILKNILSSYEISYVMTTDIMESSSNDPLQRWQEVIRIFISKDASAAVKLKAAFDDISKHHREAGLLLGYPQSAVDAFLSDNMLDWEDHPISTPEVSEVNMRLLGHRLSKDNWRNEVKYLEASGKYIHSKSAAIYADATIKVPPSN